MKLKVLTLNIFEGGLFFDNILQFLKREDPDVFCLQEVYNGQTVTLPQYYQSINILQSAFPFYKYHFAPEFLSITIEGKIDVGNAIFSRYPIIEGSSHFFNVSYGEYPQVSPNHDYSKHPCNLQYCSIVFANSKVNLYNVHGVWGTDGSDNKDRLHMSKIIVDQIKGKKNTILLGDFNVQPETKTIKNIERHLENVFKDEIQTSFNLAHKDLQKYPGYATAVVDMFFISKDMKLISKRVSSDDVSDHVPLICELEIGK